MELLKVKDDLYIPENFEKNHYYFADPEGKQKYTGITTVIGVLAKPALIGWAARMACEYVKAHLDATRDPETNYGYDELLQVLEEAKSAHTRKKEEAGAHGTDAHALVEEYIGVCLFSEEGRPMLSVAEKLVPIQPFVSWAVENVDRFLFSERRMANTELFVAGTADFAYVGKDGRRYMADFKTSSGIYGIDYWLQVAAYRLLAEAEGDEPYDGCTVVRLGKDGAFEVQHLYEYETFKEAFVACLTIYRAQAAIKNLTVN